MSGRESGPGLAGNEGYFQDATCMTAVFAQGDPESIARALGTPRSEGEPSLGTVGRLQDQPAWCVLSLKDLHPGMSSRYCDLLEEQRPEEEYPECLSGECNQILRRTTPTGVPRRAAPVSTAARVSAGTGQRALALWGSDEINEFGLAAFTAGELTDLIAETYLRPDGEGFQDEPRVVWFSQTRAQGAGTFLELLNDALVAEGLRLPELCALREAMSDPLGIDWAD